MSSSDWDILVAAYPRYFELLSLSGYRDVVLAPGVGIVTNKSFSEQCGVVAGKCVLTCIDGQMKLDCCLTRSNVGNRGWGGGSLSTAPKNSSEAAKSTINWLAGLKQILL